jgi:hypothetical protein
MYISTVHLLSTSGWTPGFEPGTVGFALGPLTTTPRRPMERKSKKIRIYFIKSVREVKVDLKITQNISKHNLTHEKGVNCPKCNHIASSNDGLNKHLKSCSKDGAIHECEECGYKSGTSYGLSLHVKKAHLDFSKVPNLRCQECDLTGFSR